MNSASADTGMAMRAHPASAQPKAVRRRTQAVLALLALATVAAAPAIYAAVHAAVRLRTASAVRFEPPTRARDIDLPVFREATNPLAILVLDVSGSMRATDPAFDQERAIRCFLRTFRFMAGGAAGDSSAPRVGIILYSSVARLVTVDGEKWVALRSEGDATRLATRLARFLGGQSGERDPRNGLNTDHLAAARVTGDLLRNYRDAMKDDCSACVIFMTDGMHDPSPLTDSDLSPASLQRNREEFWRRVTSAAAAGSPNRIGQLRATCDTLFAGGDGVLSLDDQRDPELVDPLVGLKREINTALGPGTFDRCTAGLARSAARTLPALEAVLGLTPGDMFRMIRLDATGGAVTATTAAERAGGRFAGARPSEELRIRDAQELPGSFVRAMAGWLHLIPCRVTPEGTVEVPPGVRSLAVVVSADSGDPGGRLRGSHLTAPIETGTALVSQPEPGQWAVEPARGNVMRIEAFADPRYWWSWTGVPVSYSILEATPNVGLGLFSLARGVAVDPESLYAGRPAPPSVTVAFRAGSRAAALVTWDATQRQFRFELPSPPSGSTGSVMLRAQIPALRLRDGTPTEPMTLNAETWFSDAVETSFVLHLPDGGTQAIARVDNLRTYRGAQLRAY